MSRMSFECPIIQRKEIIMRIHIFPIYYINFDSEKNGGKKSFLYEAKASASFIAMRRMSL